MRARRSHWEGPSCGVRTSAPSNASVGAGSTSTSHPLRLSLLSFVLWLRAGGKGGASAWTRGRLGGARWRPERLPGRSRLPGGGATRAACACACATRGRRRRAPGDLAARLDPPDQLAVRRRGARRGRRRLVRRVEKHGHAGVGKKKHRGGRSECLASTRPSPCGLRCLRAHARAAPARVPACQRNSIPRRPPQQLQPWRRPSRCAPGARCAVSRRACAADAFAA